MSRKRTIAGLLALTICALPRAGLADLPSDPIRFFNECGGRLAAHMEHQWLLSDPHSDETEAQLEATLAILETLHDPSDTAILRARRLEAKAAHAALLMRATFREDPWAAATAARYLTACTGLLVS